MNPNRIAVVAVAAATLSFGLFQAPAAWAQAQTPNDFVKAASTDVLDAVKADPSIQAGDIDRIVALANNKVLPYFDFTRMTEAATGPAWRTATPAQKEALQEQFKILLIRIYSSALEQARGRTIEPKALRDSPTAPEVVVRTQVVGRGDPIELDFRLERADPTWKIYDMNVGGIWLVDNYRSTFSQEILSGGLDGLIAKLTEKNKASRG